jgi:threonine dehydratase
MEPAGALSVAGLKAWVGREGVRDQSLVAVLSGANINFDRLRFVAERAEVGEAREALLAVTIPERAGAFREFCAALGRRVVTEFNYRLSGRREAHIFVGVATQSRKDAAELAAMLNASGYETVDLTDNEMAKLHVRHMVGGHAPAGIREGAHGAADELLYRFEFPERPGALMRFLSAMRTDWNISLFHYRNQGSDYGRVLVGMQVPAGDMRQFRRFLETLGYPYVDESRNPAYRLFLG